MPTSLPNFRYRLMAKLFVMMLSIVMMCQSVLIILHVFQQYDELKAQHQSHIKQIAASLQHTIPPYLGAFDSTQLTQLFQPFLNDQAIRQIRLSSSQGQQLILQNIQLATLSDDSWQPIDLSIPLQLQNNVVGELVLQTDAGYIREHLLDSMLQQLLELLLLLGLFAISFAYGFHYLVFKPLRQLTLALDQAIQSPTGIVKNPLLASHDEFADVAKSISKLSARLADDVVQISLAKSALQQEKDKSELAMQEIQHIQTALLEAEKQASLGALVSGVAHEVNSPLGVVITSLSCIEDNIKQIRQDVSQSRLTKTSLNHELTKIQDAVTLMTTNTTRAANIIHNFKQLAQDPRTEQPSCFDLSDYLAKLLQSLREPLETHQIELKVQIEPEIQIWAAASLISQVVTALLSNVMVHAYPGQQGGICWLSLKRKGLQIVLTCQDWGLGIDPRLQHKVFEPFYTTKLGVGSSGLGLAIVYRIVKFNLRGEIELKSNLNQGCTVHIVFWQHEHQLCEHLEVK